MWDYSPKVKELFYQAVHDPQKSHMGEISNPDGHGEFGSLACGDAIEFFFKTEKVQEDSARKGQEGKEVIVQARYKTFGCTSAIASSEALCFLLEHHRPTPQEALQITNQDIINFLGGMPEQKIHCSVMGQEVLKRAVEDWAQKRNIKLEFNDGSQEILCSCFNLTRGFIEEKIKEMHLHTVDEVKAALKAGSACGKCLEGPNGIKAILAKQATCQDGSCGVCQNPQVKDSAGIFGHRPHNTPEEEQEVKQVITAYWPKVEQQFAGIKLVAYKQNRVYFQGPVEATALTKFLQENLQLEVKAIDLN